MNSYNLDHQISKILKSKFDRLVPFIFPISTYRLKGSREFLAIKKISIQHNFSSHFVSKSKFEKWFCHLTKTRENVSKWTESHNLRQVF